MPNVVVIPLQPSQRLAQTDFASSSFTKTNTEIQELFNNLDVPYSSQSEAIASSPGPVDSQFYMSSGLPAEALATMPSPLNVSFYLTNAIAQARNIYHDSWQEGLKIFKNAKTPLTNAKLVKLQFFFARANQVASLTASIAGQINTALQKVLSNQ